MTQEQIDTVTNAAIHLHELADQYGPRLLATAAALLAVAAGYRAGTEVAIRYQARQLVRYCQLYLRHPGIRAALDNNYQPRKEKP